MVRFIIFPIYKIPGVISTIYIPIWLDLLCVINMIKRLTSADLHSNMVRFIINIKIDTIIDVEIIYIPIWLDLLLLNYRQRLNRYLYLHSNMVRFIIKSLFANV